MKRIHKDGEEMVVWTWLFEGICLALVALAWGGVFVALTSSMIS